MPSLHSQRPVSEEPGTGVTEGSIVDDTLEPIAEVPLTLDQAGRNAFSTPSIHWGPVGQPTEGQD